MPKRKRPKPKRRPNPPDELPRVNNWLPRRQEATNLSTAFSHRCALGDEQLRRLLAHERSMVVDSFDSGIPFEAAVGEEISRLIPRRYKTTTGVLVDRDGFTSGQCDIVVFNDLWFTAVNAPALAEPPRLLIPIEGVYAVGEVKQRLTRRTLDDAMEKLVVCHRLHRPPTYANRLVENREADSCPHGLTNSLFSFVLAGETDPGGFQGLIERFFDINRKLRRLEVVRCLCVLGAGAVTWSFSDPLRDGEIRPALFMRDDLFHPIIPTYSRATTQPPLFSLMQILHLHLFKSVLAPEDIATVYGHVEPTAINIAIPREPDIALAPDQEWLERLQRPCNTHRPAD
jgi:hypothetical protein